MESPPQSDRISVDPLSGLPRSDMLTNDYLNEQLMAEFEVDR